MGSLAAVKPELLDRLQVNTNKKDWKEAMVSKIDPFLRRKWEYAFATFFDINKDQVLEWADFEVLLERIKETRGADSMDYKRETEGMKKIWQELRRVADQDNDSVVTEQEWQKMWFNTISSVAKAKQEGWQKLYLDYMFHLIDSSGDEVVDLSEYIEMMSHYNIDRRRAIWAFDRFAKTPDGRQMNSITYDQFVKLWQDFFYSTDPNAPGNFLFGDVSNQYNPAEVDDFLEDADDDYADSRRGSKASIL